MTIALWPYVAGNKFHLDPRLANHHTREELRDIRKTGAYKVANAVCFDVTNVSNFLYEQSSQDYWEWKSDFPCLAPPFEMCWMEFRSPRTIRTEKGVSLWPGGYEAMGALVSGQRFSDSVLYEPRLKEILGTPQMAGYDVAQMQALFARFQETSGDYWSVQIQAFIRQGRWVAMVPIQLNLMLDPHGALASQPFVSANFHPEESEKDELTNLSMYFPFALALSFLHCKNVKIEDTPDPRPRQSRRADERAGLPTPQYKTLVIEPMKKVLQTEGGIATNGLKKALHICRGHFSHYSEEKPLFGKYSGQFWIPAHVRGSADAGTVVKDYDVKAPKGAQAA